MYKRTLVLGLVLLILIVVDGILFVGHLTRKTIDRTSISIIISPHFDDAALSLGGLLSREDRPALVATFFTDPPETATTTKWDKLAGFTDSSDIKKIRTEENHKAMGLFKAETATYSYMDDEYGRDESGEELQSDLAQDIQTLIAAHANQTVYIYAPALFTEGLTHPDHEVLHKAFVDVANGFPNKNVKFFFYEDLPYTIAFNKKSPISLKKNIETESGLSLETVNIPLSQMQVNEKIRAIKSYDSQMKAFKNLDVDITGEIESFTENRCGENQACEVVYQIPQL
jgi:LmbE family N-acetylglucosaminyl deacetylase